MKKKITLLAIGFTFLVGCGYQCMDNNVIGQVKKICHNTPLICNNYADVDVSLGVMKNGVGSMSTEDNVFVVMDQEQEKILEDALEKAKLVKIYYNVARWRWCTDVREITKVEMLN